MADKWRLVNYGLFQLKLVTAPAIGCW